MKTKSQVVFLRGKKTILRPIEESDLPLCVKWMNDPEVTHFLKARMPIMLIAEKKWFEKLADSEDNVILAITTLDGRCIGVMGIHRIDWVNRTATTGAFIGEKQYWGKGYGTDAKMVLLKYAFDTLGLRKMCSRVYDFNARSLAYSKHCGYTEEGRLKKHVFRDGEYYDVVVLGLFREDWLPYWKKYQKKKS